MIRYAYFSKDIVSFNMYGEVQDELLWKDDFDEVDRQVDRIYEFEDMGILNFHQIIYADLYMDEWASRFWKITIYDRTKPMKEANSNVEET